MAAHQCLDGPVLTCITRAHCIFHAAIVSEAMPDTLPRQLRFRCYAAEAAAGMARNSSFSLGLVIDVFVGEATETKLSRHIH